MQFLWISNLLSQMTMKFQHHNCTYHGILEEREFSARLICWRKDVIYQGKSLNCTCIVLINFAKLFEVNSDICGVRICTALLQEELPEVLFVVKLCRESKIKALVSASSMQLSKFKGLGTLSYTTWVHFIFISSASKSYISQMRCDKHN